MQGKIIQYLYKKVKLKNDSKQKKCNIPANQAEKRNE